MSKEIKVIQDRPGREAKMREIAPEIEKNEGRRARASDLKAACGGKGNYGIYQDVVDAYYSEQDKTEPAEEIQIPSSVIDAGQQALKTAWAEMQRQAGELVAGKQKELDQVREKARQATDDLKAEIRILAESESQLEIQLAETQKQLEEAITSLEDRDTRILQLNTKVELLGQQLAHEKEHQAEEIAKAVKAAVQEK